MSKIAPHAFVRARGRPSPRSRCQRCQQRRDHPVHATGASEDGADLNTQLLTIAEVGERLRLSRSEVYRLKEDGALRFVYPRPRAPRIRTSDLALFVRGLHDGAGPQGAATPHGP